MTTTCVLTVCQTLYLVLLMPFSPFAWKNKVYIFYLKAAFSSVQSLSCVQLFATPRTAAHQASLSITNSELTQTPVHWVGDAIQPSHPLQSPSPPAFNLSSIRVFFNESVLHIRWPKYWHFSFSISPSNEYSGLISFPFFLRMIGY